ncbi:MAG: transcription-repair coupling factor [Clostridiales Family XIII bacterium]|jgi:transcription-repair coupling factor (superfamily II helicase)|nr:transcription-repair coupling factor [Clostridiales Family XIII bacterium]
MDRKITHISGLADMQTAPAAARLNESGSVLLITPTFEWAAGLARNIRFFTDRPVLVLPEAEPFFYNFDAKSRSDLNERLAALTALTSGGNAMVVAPVSAAIKKLLPKENFLSRILRIRADEDRDPEELRDRLRDMGYERLPMAESPGTFSLRGDILDVYPPSGEDPYRIEFFGETVESIRTFDAETQKSKEKVDACVLYPAAEFLPTADMAAAGLARIRAVYEKAGAGADAEIRKALGYRLAAITDAAEEGINRRILENYTEYFTDAPGDLADYLPEDGMVAVADLERALQIARLSEKEAREDFERLLTRGFAVREDSAYFSGGADFERLLGKRRLTVFTPGHEKPPLLKKPEEHRKYEGRLPAGTGGRIEIFKSELKRYRKLKFHVTVVCGTPERARGVRDLLLAEGLADGVNVVMGALTCGMELTSEKKVWLWDGDIFRSEKKRRARREKDAENRAPIRSLLDIKPGDYVVHEGHGIGRYTGIEQLEVQGKRRDYLKIAYAGTDVLYVPVDQMALIQKYIGGGEAKPRVHKLSGSEWKNAKAKARADIAEMAVKIAELSAKRLTVKGHAFSPDTVWQAEFEEKFPYEETADQLRSIRSIKADMERPVPMDRLLCGDVGYGKTEVALRAVFKCAIEGKQAAVLVPTTILASQHFSTFEARLADFPIQVRMLSRFLTDAEQKQVAEEVASGACDVVIGTHRLLSEDVKFKDLGLLVIDEEQRFGVQHKEKIKALRANVDVLTLTATPIPRTLHMSLMGIRDMDIIEEPPEDRYPVQTYVMEENDEILRETIRRELARGGQAFVVSRKVSGIERIAARVRALVPEARVAVGHGQMGEAALENVMLDFVEGRFDVLVATTIIESGLDIPNVNTILILDADHFGLSQLYQLRGRVGRSNRVAFAYLLYRRGKILSETAAKRLRTIREFTEFGAGFKIAVRDLEIRGAGNLLGAEQSGHMTAIGYELYCKMVEDAVGALAGREQEPEERDVQLDITVSAYIPEYFIPDESLKLTAYKQITAITDEEMLAEEMAEFRDRFGAVPESVRTLAYAALLRHLCVRAGIERVFEEPGRFVLVYASAERFDPVKVAEAAAAYPAQLRIKGTVKPMLRFKPEKTGPDVFESDVLKQLVQLVRHVV